MLPEELAEVVEYQQEKVRNDLIRDLIRLRKERRITQEELALRTGIARSNISRIEKGTYNITLDTLVKIAVGIGMTLDINLVDFE
ncbi:MAG: helix-turn-helix domain-containing protein [Lachnospiraceae bacterium]|nr:helix-turn-helix domain-containing protein [Lachnospiraceae bacterium]